MVWKNCSESPIILERTDRRCTKARTTNDEKHKISKSQHLTIHRAE